MTAPQVTLPASLPKLVTDIGVLAPVTTALLSYFGWVRLRYEARELGFDVTAMDFSTTDYLLKCLNVLFMPLILVLLIGLLAHQAHLRITVPRITRGRPECWLR